MSEVQNECNPCLCTTVKWGTLFIGGFDVVYGILYIVRANRVFHQVESQPQYYINDLKSHDTFYWKYGNYLIMILAGAGLFIGIKFMPLDWTTYVCFAWTAIRVILTIMLSYFCHHLIHSHLGVYRYYGYEVMFNIVLHFYMIYVVYMYGKESREQFRTNKTCRALKLQFSKVYPYKEDLKRLGMMSTSIYNIQPHTFQSTISGPADFVAEVRLVDWDSDDSWDEEKYKQYLGEISTTSSIIHESFRKAVLEDDGDIISGIKKRISSMDQIDRSKAALTEDTFSQVSTVVAPSSLQSVEVKSTASEKPPLEERNSPPLTFADSETSIASEQWYIGMTSSKTQLNVGGLELRNNKELKK